MFVKLIGGTPQYYTLGQLRRDNPNTSFPQSVPDDVLADYDVYPLTPSVPPVIDNLTEFSSETIALVDGVWSQVWAVATYPVEVVSARVRAHRVQLLQETDWMALSDNTMSEAIAAYRQALRDITNQVGFPFNVVWPEKPSQ